MGQTRASVGLLVTCCVVSCSRTPESMVLVRGGTFTMGDAFGLGDPDEVPRHEVEVSDFYLAPYPVTRHEFRKFVEATGYSTTAETGGGLRVYVTEEKKVETRDGGSWRDPGFPQGDDHPVVGVSWFDAVRYCNWRSEQEGLRPCFKFKEGTVSCDFSVDGYRLPTEAEFEFAARCRGQERKYPWGDGTPEIDGRPIANIKDDTAHRDEGWGKHWEGYDDGFVFTSPVDAMSPNELGLYDMGGNVYQWCWDWFAPEYYGIGNMRDPVGPGTGEMRSARGSGFGCPLHRLRASNRGAGKPSASFENTGFRVARSNQ